MLSWACTSLSSTSAPLEMCFGGRTLFFCPSSSPPWHRLPVVTSECVQGASSCSQRQTFKARCCRFQPLMQTPLLLPHFVNKHTKLFLPLFVVGGRSLVFGSEPSQNKPHLGVEHGKRDRKLECHLLLLGTSTGQDTESAMGHSGSPCEP